jgi:hypothetical protein
MKDSVVFSRLIADYGSADQEEDGKVKDGKVAGAARIVDDTITSKAVGALMQAEERNTGSVSWQVYGKYLRFAGGIAWAPAILVLLSITQGAQGKLLPSTGRQKLTTSFIVGNTLFLGFWTSNSIPGFRQVDYMAVYAGFGTLETRTFTDFDLIRIA